EGCGTHISAFSFGTPVSRGAERIKQGMDAYEGGKCFIATELYGADSIQVAILRRFRDQALLPTKRGQIFVALYYRLGPLIVRLMHICPSVRSLSRLLVASLARFVHTGGTRCFPKKETGQQGFGLARCNTLRNFVMELWAALHSQK